MTLPLQFGAHSVLVLYLSNSSDQKSSNWKSTPCCFLILPAETASALQMSTAVYMPPYTGSCTCAMNAPHKFLLISKLGICLFFFPPLFI